MAAHRNNVEISVQAQNWPILGNLESDKSLRVMAFCLSDPGSVRQDISFPHQSEIKVNGGDVKANLRGLKNKPGSTRPVDLTPYLRLKPPQYPNKIEMTYALTTKASSDLSRASYLIDSIRCLISWCLSSLSTQSSHFSLLTSNPDLLLHGLRREDHRS